MPGFKDVVLKLIADRKTGKVLGGQGTGKGELAKRIDVLATAITFGATVENLADLDLAYAPQFNTPMDILHGAANTIRNKMDGLADSVTPVELKAKLDCSDDFLLLDVRGPKEWEAWRIDCQQGKLVPQNVLTSKLDELPKDKKIVTTCRGGTRAYQAARMLKCAGFDRVEFLEGSMIAWPYEAFGGEKE